VDLAHEEVLLRNQRFLVRQGLPEPSVQLLQPALPAEFCGRVTEPPGRVQLRLRPGP
jgi:hypothetical protein